MNYNREEIILLLLNIIHRDVDKNNEVYLVYV